MDGIDDLLMTDPRPGAQNSGFVGGGVPGRSNSSAGMHPASQQQRVSIGSGYHSRYGDGATSTVASSARQSTSYSAQCDVRVGAGVVVTSHRQSQRR